jgi:hypothetical protein
MPKPLLPQGFSHLWLCELSLRYFAHQGKAVPF